MDKEKVILDAWQKEVMESEGNIVVRSGRQVGKSTVISQKAGEYAVNHKDKTILVVAAVERQALLLFEKILSYIFDNYKSFIKKGKDRPTKHKICLNNGCVIHCLPTGMSGYGIRGFTVDLLIADEAAFIPEDVWTAVTPMLAITKGDIILLSTPFGKGGYFYRCFSDKNFKHFHVSSEDCPRKNQEFLDRERERMTKIQYAQEYLGEFVDKLLQFYPDDLIKSCMVLKRRDRIIPGRRYYLGVDVARMGADESTFEIVDRISRTCFEQVENLVTRETLLPETSKMCLNLEGLWNFRQLFVDDGGMGVGVFDDLISDNRTKRKTIAINSSARPLDAKGKRRKKTLKADIHNNMRMLMEKGYLKLLDDDEIFLSLKSVQAEYADGKLKFFGNYCHIADGLVRACWCSKDKRLSIWIA